MNNHINEEIIEVGGKEYTLFINRQGIVNWEKKTKLQKEANKIKEMVEQDDEEIEITDDTNPFEMYSIDEDEEVKKIEYIYIQFYWVALYTHHKLTISETEKWFSEAKEEYGFNQLAELVHQMVDNANRDNTPKKLKALKQTK